MEKIFTAKTIDEAKALAAQEFGVAAEEIDFEILEQPRKTLFGGLKGEAKVNAIYEAPAAPAERIYADEPEDEENEPAAEEISAEEESSEVCELPEDFDVNSSAKVQAAKQYLTDVLHALGLEGFEITPIKKDGNVVLDISGEKLGVVIGRRGETLDSIQYLARLVAGKNKAENEYSRISVNVGNYREKRKAALCSLAKKNAQKVLKYGRNFTFEPMNPYERRIIHTAIQEVEGVTSYSVGADLSRRVVISLEEGVKPTHPSKGGYNRGRGGRRPSGGPRRSNAAPKSDAAQRAPKTDAGAQGISLYGKIN